MTKKPANENADKMQAEDATIIENGAEKPSAPPVPIGAKVALASGGRAMTLAGVTRDNRALCVWMDDAGTMHEYGLPPQCLVTLPSR